MLNNHMKFFFLLTPKPNADNSRGTKIEKRKKERKKTSKLVKDEYSLGYTNILLKMNFLKCKKYSNSI